MDENGFDGSDEAADLISIEQLRRLVSLVDQSGVSEIELEREGFHLALRKVKAPEPAAVHGGENNSSNSAHMSTLMPLIQMPEPAEPKEPERKEHKILAPLVGTFHVWAKPRGGAVVAVGDRVKAGQLVGTIESLNVLNEVESPVAGRVTEIHVQEGQPVEYGQLLVTLDTTDGAKGK